MRNLVFSNYVSARSLRLGLRQLGEELVAFEAPGFMVPAARSGPQPGDRLFFTDEQSLGHYLHSRGYRFHPARLTFPLDDKQAFAELLRSLGADPVPHWPLAAAASAPEYPIVLKARHSWREGRPVARGHVCRDEPALRAGVDALCARGLRREWLFLQKYLPDGVTNCWSVSGFHDPADRRRCAVLVTRKLASRAGALGYALAIRTEPDPAGLAQRAAALLDRLDYRGPYELEFLHDATTGRFHELELNPRFWLQHSIFSFARDNALLKLYTDRELDGTEPPEVPVLWVSGVGLLAALARPWQGQGRELLRLVRGRGPARLLIDPPLPVAARLLAEEALRRWRGR